MLLSITASKSSVKVSLVAHVCAVLKLFINYCFFAIPLKSILSIDLSCKMKYN